MGNESTAIDVQKAIDGMRNLLDDPMEWTFDYLEKVYNSYKEINESDHFVITSITHHYYKVTVADVNKAYKIRTSPLYKALQGE